MSAAPPQPETAEGATGETFRRQTTGGPAARKKGESVRAWLVVDQTGQSQAVEAGKHAIMRRTSLPGRDLRILDPALSYPSAVLGRERAIVVNLEHIKAIITAEEVMFLNADHPLVKPFIEKLLGIFRHRQAAKEASQVAGGGINNVELPTVPANPPQHSMGDSMNKNKEGTAERAQHVAEKEHGLKTLPFEFVALEACLEVACTSLDIEASRLEQEAHPHLDKLTAKISTLSLDSVREIKRRLVEIIGRVQQVRDQLEHLLDDDEDMAEMYLTEKLEEQLENSCISSTHEQENLTEEVPSDAEHRLPVETTQGDRNSAASHTDIQEWENHPTVEPNSLGIASHKTHASSHMYCSTTKNLDVKELEMILEAYFVQIDGTLHKLSYLREYVDDTEDYINIMLDDKQNHLLQMGVMLSAATVVVSAFVAMTGVFGMNITIELFDPEKAGMYEFLWTVGGGTIASFVIYVPAFVWAKKKRLLE